jgi:hypothetical protein
LETLITNPLYIKFHCGFVVVDYRKIQMIPVKPKYTKAQKKAYQASKREQKSLQKENNAVFRDGVRVRPNMLETAIKRGHVVQKNPVTDAVMSVVKHVPVVGPVVGTIQKAVSKPVAKEVKAIEKKAETQQMPKASILPVSTLGAHNEMMSRVQVVGSVGESKAAGAVPAALNYTKSYSQGAAKFYGRRTIQYGGQTRGVIRIRHSEPMGPLPGSAGYVAYQQFVNPSNPVIHPWLAGLASRFDLYRYLRAALEVKSEEAATAKGVIGVNFDYEANDPLPPDRITFEQQTGTKVGSPWRNFKAEMRNVHAQNFYYVGDGGNNEDPRVTNQALMSWFTVDCSDTQNNAELWFSYDIELMEPAAFSSVSSLAPAVWQFPGSYIASATTPVGMIAGSAVPGSNSNMSLWYVSGSNSSAQMHLYLPSKASAGARVSVPGSYVVVVAVRDTSSYGQQVSSLNVVTTAAVTAHSTMYPGSTTFTSAVGTGVTSSTSFGVGYWMYYYGRFDVSSALPFTPGASDTIGPFISINLNSLGSISSNITVQISVFALSNGQQNIIMMASHDEKTLTTTVKSAAIISCFDGVSKIPLVDTIVNVPPRIGNFSIEGPNIPCAEAKVAYPRRDSADFVHVDQKSALPITGYNPFSGPQHAELKEVTFTDAEKAAILAIAQRSSSSQSRTSPAGTDVPTPKGVKNSVSILSVKNGTTPGNS